MVWLLSDVRPASSTVFLTVPVAPRFAAGALINLTPGAFRIGAIE